MRDFLLQGAGVIAILVSIAHGVIGETRVFARGTIEPPRLRMLLRLVWQAGTIAWEVLTSISRRVPRFYREP